MSADKKIVKAVGALFLITMILGMIDTAGSGGVLYMPGALFELLLLPIWLFVKGFNSAAVRQ